MATVNYTTELLSDRYHKAIVDWQKKNFPELDLLMARWNDWKANFAGIDGNIATGSRKVTNWPILVNLRADPYEKMPFQSAMYLRWYADNLWLFVPIQLQVKEFLKTIPQYPFQEGTSLNAAGINYQTLKAAQALKRLHELESLSSPTN